METALKMAESRYLTRIMRYETITSDLLIISYVRSKYDDEHSKFISDNGYSDVEIKFILAHHIHNTMLFEVGCRKIADIYSKITAHYSGFCFYSVSGCYFHIRKHNLLNTYKFASAYDHRKWPIIAIALAFYS